MKFKYIQPQSLEEAQQSSAGNWKDSAILAGGTDLLGLLKHGTEVPKKVINLKMIPDLETLKFNSKAEFEIGSLVKIAEIASNPLVNEHFHALAEAARQVASPQLRNVGTIGGNLCQRPRCWYFRNDFNCLRKGGDECYAVGGENKYHCIIGGGPCFIVHPSDLAVSLLALKAKIEIYSNGKIKQISINDFFVLPEEDLFRENILKPGEIVTKILIPQLDKNTRTAFLKARMREVWDFAMVSVAVSIAVNGNKVKNANIAFGGVAPKPWLEKTAAEMLKGKMFSQKSIQQAVDATLTEGEPMDQNGYKIILVKNLLKEALSSL